MNTIESVVVPNGYSIVNFVLLYIIAASLRKVYINRYSKMISLVLFLVNTLIIFVLSIILPQIAYQYYSPFVISSAVALFLLFREFRFSNRIVNFVSKSTFTVFLLHYAILSNMNIEKFAQKNTGIMLLHLLFSIIIIWLICIVIDVIYSFVIRQVKRLFPENCIINRKYEV